MQEHGFRKRDLEHVTTMALIEPRKATLAKMGRGEEQEACKVFALLFPGKVLVL